MAEEFNAFLDNDTWELVPLTPYMNVVGCKWIFKTKFKSVIERYKARLVALGNHQQAGIDYHETFSPVVKSSTVRLLLSLAASCRWIIRQLDVKNSFLHGFLDEEIYMKQPPGFIHPHYPNHVYRLKKSLYGLKQAPRAWSQCFSSFLLANSFVCSKVDIFMFVYRHQSNVLVLLLYVDEMLLTGNNPTLIHKIHLSFISPFCNEGLGWPSLLSWGSSCAYSFGPLSFPV